MTTTITPYDIHIGEWVYADIDGKKTPVMIDTIRHNIVTAASRSGGVFDSFDFNSLSPIPVDEKTVNLFDWSNMKGMSLHQYRWTGEYYMRYIDESRVLQKWFKKNGVLFVHELQQFYYDKKSVPLQLVTRLP